MARINARRGWRHLPGPLLAALAVVTLTAAPMTAAASTTPATAAATTGPATAAASTSPATAAALTQAFEAGRHIPAAASAASALAPCTRAPRRDRLGDRQLHPVRFEGKQVAAGFQDGAAPVCSAFAAVRGDSSTPARTAAARGCPPR